MFAEVPLTALAPACAPFHEASLNDLSSSVPTSVTRPTFRALPPDAAGEPPPVPLQAAAATRTRPVSATRPIERMRIYSSSKRGRASDRAGAQRSHEAARIDHLTGRSLARILASPAVRMRGQV